MKLVLILCFSVLFALAALGKSETFSKAYNLTILHHTAGLSSLLPDGDEAGVARFRTVLAQSRRNALNGPRRNQKRRFVVALNTGSNIAASEEFTAGLNAGVFFDARALDMMSYEAITFGLSDFSFGPDLLADFLTTGFQRVGVPPYLATNMDFSAEPSFQTLVDSGVIVKSVTPHDLPYGIVAAISEGLSSGNIVVNEVVASLQAEVDALRANGVKTIIVVSHLGAIAGDLDLATALSGVDVLISGGAGGTLLADTATDLLLPSDSEEDVFGKYPLEATGADGNTVLVISVPGRYGYLGELKIQVKKNGRIKRATGGPRRVVSRAVGPDGVRPDKKMQNNVEIPLKLAIERLAMIIIGETGVELDATEATIRTKETNLGDLVADAILAEAQKKSPIATPVVSIINGGAIRGEIYFEGTKPRRPAAISVADTVAMLPFNNFITIVPRIRRDQFKEILEHAVSGIPGEFGGFPQIGGFKIVYNAAGTPQELDESGNVVVPGTRIWKVMLDDGTVVVDEGKYKRGRPIHLATSEFLSQGGDGYPFRGARSVKITTTTQQSLVNFIEDDLAAYIRSKSYPVSGLHRILRLN